MKITILSLASIFGAVAAFAPTQNSLNKKASTWALHAVRREELKGYYTLDRDIGDKIPKDFGFDPLGLAKTKGGLYFMREAEIKHARLAMLAAAGWPVAELFDRPLAKVFGADPVVDSVSRSPSVLNGGLDKVNPLFWVTIILAASAIDIFQINVANDESNEDYFPGNIGFDPLELYPVTQAGREKMQMKEIRNGRLAMIAITAFAFQEYVSNLGVVEETPAFFKPFFGLF